MTHKQFDWSVCDTFCETVQTLPIFEGDTHNHLNNCNHFRCKSIYRKNGVLFLPSFDVIRTLHRVSYIHRNGTDLFTPYWIKRKCELCVFAAVYGYLTPIKLIMWFVLPFFSNPELCCNFNYFLMLTVKNVGNFPHKIFNPRQVCIEFVHWNFIQYL